MDILKLIRTISAISVVAVVATGVHPAGAAIAVGSQSGAATSESAVPVLGIDGEDGDSSGLATRATSSQSNLKVSNFRVASSGRSVTGTVHWDRALLGKKNRFTVNLMAFTAASGSTPKKIVGRQYASFSKNKQKIRLKVSSKKAAKLRTSRVLVLTATQQRGMRTKGSFDRSVAASAYLRNSVRQGVGATSVRAAEPRFFGAVFAVVGLVAAGIELSKKIREDTKKKKKPKVVAPKSKSPHTVAVGANLKGTQAKGADLKASVVIGSNLIGANLAGANLTRAILTGTDLKAADLRGANLAGVNLRGVDLTGANLTGANLAGADLTGAILTGVVGAVLPQYISFAPLANINLSERSTVVSATGGASGQPVVFASLTAGTCTTGGVNGSTVTFVSEGTCTIQATQAGNSKFLAAPGVTRSFAIMTAESCAAGGTCEPGDVGPGGGRVFYVDYERPAGSRVFEAAPNGWSGGADPTATSGCLGTVIPGASGGGMGAGRENTAAIIAGCDTPGIAARLADQYVNESASDWYLPSIGEMEALCHDLYSQPAGPGVCTDEQAPPTGFTAAPYQTSSQLSAAHVFIQYFPAIGSLNVGPRDFVSPVRPIRSF